MSAASLPFDVVCKILSDSEIPIDTKHELEPDLGVKLLNPRKIPSDFKEKLDRIYTSRTPTPISRFDTQIYKNGRLTVLRKLGCPYFFYQLQDSRRGKPIITEYEANTKVYFQNASKMNNKYVPPVKMDKETIYRIHQRIQNYMNTPTVLDQMTQLLS